MGLQVILEQEIRLDEALKHHGGAQHLNPIAEVAEPTSCRFYLEQEGQLSSQKGTLLERGKLR